jgi:glycine dehydrogenase
LLPKTFNAFRVSGTARPYASTRPPSSLFAALDSFPERHIGPDNHEASHMLSILGYDSMDAFVGATVPSKIRISATTITNDSIPAFSESEMYYRAKQLGSYNQSFKSYIGMGYHNAVVPPVILRNASPESAAVPYFLKLLTGHGKSGLVHPIHSLSA